MRIKTIMMSLALGLGLLQTSCAPQPQEETNAPKEQ